MQLTGDPRRADLLVDLSNVCSREILGGPGVGLDRFRQAVGVFESWSGMDDVHVFAVADNSLRKRLVATDDRDQLNEWVRAGLVEAVPGADERLLDLVALTDGILMTWDRFEGHRGAYPWLQGDCAHFVLVHEVDHELVIGLRDLGIVKNHRVSERAEIDALKAAHLLDTSGRPDARVLSRWWLCQDPKCSLFSRMRASGQPIPLRDGGQLVCSLHRTVLADDGPRPRQLQLKVMVDKRVCERVLVTEGAEMRVGRGTGIDLDVGIHLDPAQRDLVSREHLTLWVEGAGLLARDEHSKNGSALLTDDGTRETRLQPGQPVRVRTGCTVVLGGVARLVLSGRRYPGPVGRAKQRGGAAEPVTTRLVAEP